jgi:hypothetical protein
MYIRAGIKALHVVLDTRGAPQLWNGGGHFCYVRIRWGICGFEKEVRCIGRGIRFGRCDFNRCGVVLRVL